MKKIVVLIAVVVIIANLTITIIFKDKIVLDIYFIISVIINVLLAIFLLFLYWKEEIFSIYSKLLNKLFTIDSFPYNNMLIAEKDVIEPQSKEFPKKEMIEIIKEIDEFSNDELCILLLTNSIGNKDYFAGKKQILTAKESYYWGIIVSSILEKHPEIEIDNIIREIQYAIRKNSVKIKKYYRELPKLSSSSQTELFYSIIKTINKAFKIELAISEIEKRASNAYEKLIEKELIEDPIFLSFLSGSLSFAVLGFIPFGFTKKTKKGNTIYRKIEALFWTYEFSNKHNIKTLKLKFRIWKIVKAIKTVIADETDEETK